MLVSILFSTLVTLTSFCLRYHSSFFCLIEYYVCIIHALIQSCCVPCLKCIFLSSFILYFASLPGFTLLLRGIQSHSYFELPSQNTRFNLGGNTLWCSKGDRGRRTCPPSQYQGLRGMGWVESQK